MCSCGCQKLGLGEAVTSRWEHGLMNGGNVAIKLLVPCSAIPEYSYSSSYYHSTSSTLFFLQTNQSCQLTTTTIPTVPVAPLAAMVYVMISNQNNYVQTANKLDRITPLVPAPTVLPPVWAQTPAAMTPTIRLATRPLLVLTNRTC